ncbi:MAG: sulfite exporter TauE/SafE family protein [Rubrobacter sp.]|nr:sulfite exporter TauE/SafE family protein [Rubrobacter sp.]
MLGTVLPMGYGEREASKLVIAPWLYGLSGLGSSIALGSILGAFGSALPLFGDVSMRRFLAGIVAGLVALIYSMNEMGLVRVWNPEFRRQVPQSWSRMFTPRAAAAMYGAGLGVGFATYIPVATYYVPVVWSFVLGKPLWGGVAMSLYGLGGTAPIVWFGQRFDRIEQSAHVASVILPRWTVPMHLLNGIVLAGGGAFLLAANSIDVHY